MVSAVQIQIYQFLARHQGPPPTVRDIAAHIGRSISTTHASLAKLKDKGFITWQDGRSRTITLVEL